MEAEKQLKYFLKPLFFPSLFQSSSVLGIGDGVDKSSWRRLGKYYISENVSSTKKDFGILRPGF